jgi:deoxyadenosine/deoxycytidine kinase
MAFNKRGDVYEKYKFLKGSILIVEGNISSGKSTLTKHMSKFLNEIGIKAHVYEEPILQSYLELFLSDMKRYAFGFQMSMLLERQCLYDRAQKFADEGGVAIVDRGFHGDKVFAILHNENGNITDAEMRIYEDVFSRMQFQAPSFVLYLEVDPKVNVKRCNSRSRNGECNAYKISYFQKLNELYEIMITEMTAENGILRFDWNKEMKGDEFRTSMLFVLDEMRQSYFSEGF